MKKLTLIALLLGAFAFIGTTSLSAEGMKCGAGKCGASMKQEMKCGASMSKNMKANGCVCKDCNNPNCAAKKDPTKKCDCKMQMKQGMKCGAKNMNNAPMKKCGN